MASKKPKIPTFHNDQEERAFWNRHSVEEFAGVEDVETLRIVAKRKGVGHTTLVRSIVEQWVAQVRQKTKHARSPQRRRAAQHVEICTWRDCS